MIFLLSQLGKTRPHVTEYSKPIQQQCIHLLYESLVGQCEYKHNPRVPFGDKLLIQRVQYFIDIYK